jgi:hypothetical protein
VKVPRRCSPGVSLATVQIPFLFVELPGVGDAFIRLHRIPRPLRTAQVGFGKSTAASTSRYNQAIRLKPLKLSLDEAEEAYQVVQEMIKVFRSQPNQLKRLRVTN